MAVYPIAMSAATEPLEVAERHLCETCKHCVLVTDHASSGHGRLRVLEVCVADHDKTGEDWGDVIDEPVAECANHGRME